MSSPARRRARRVVSCCLIAAAVTATARARAQQPAAAAPSGTISGSVIDARSAAPLAHATVTLTSADGFAVLLDPRGTASSFELGRTVTTSATGAYRFSDLPIGAYRLRIQRMGYEPATIDVRLGDTGTSPLSIGLVILPVRLRPVEVRAHDADLLPDDRAAAGDDNARVAAARARQRAFLSTDTRELTLADVAESATLGGSDVLRSLQRLPGVAPFDDWSAKLWVRANRWDHNRIYFDGLPLFDPLGVLGRTSGVSADAIGGAFLHPGVRPVSLGGDGATRIDLRSRPAMGGGDWRGSAELSQFGVSGGLERTLADTAVGLLVTAQHSLGRWLPHALFADALADRSYEDAQASLRGDVNLGDGKRIETSGLFTRDARGYPADLGYRTSQDWRNAVGRVTFSGPVGPLALSQSVGMSSFASSELRWLGQPSSPIAAPVTSSVDYVTMSGRIGSRSAARDGTTAGYDLIAQRSSFDGTNESLALGDPSHARALGRSSLGQASAWVDHRAELGSRLTVENGVRLDFGAARGLDAIRPAASAQALFAVSPDTRASIGASRVHQYVQAVDVPAVGQGQASPASWITSGGDVPVMTVDNAMAGIEHWAGAGVLLAANTYLRHTSGAIASDPTPGPLLQRPLFVLATESASGVEVSARKLTGRSTGLLAYSYGNATMRASGLSFPAPSSRTHALDAALSLRAGGFSLGGAYTLTSGAPYTRTVLAAALGGSATSVAPQVPVREAPNAQRLPAYESLDVSLDYTRVARGIAFIGFAGAQNVLSRTNSTWYEISGYCEGGQTPLVASPQCRDHDLLQAPVKLVPTIGLRLVVR